MRRRSEPTIVSEEETQKNVNSWEEFEKELHSEKAASNSTWDRATFVIPRARELGLGVGDYAGPER